MPPRYSATSLMPPNSLIHDRGARSTAQTQWITGKSQKRSLVMLFSALRLSERARWSGLCPQPPNHRIDATRPERPGYRYVSVWLAIFRLYSVPLLTVAAFLTTQPLAYMKGCTRSKKKNTKKNIDPVLRSLSALSLPSSRVRGRVTVCSASNTSVGRLAQLLLHPLSIGRSPRALPSIGFATE